MTYDLPGSMSNVKDESEMTYLWEVTSDMVAMPKPAGAWIMDASGDLGLS